ncbi:hypothetical protein D7S88_30150 [Ralstonia insidiosa]|nr:hypothetical protein [Ralstonia insidiosa]
MLSSASADSAFCELICKILFEEKSLKLGRDVRLHIATRYFNGVVAITVLVSYFLGQMAVQTLTEVIDLLPAKAFKRGFRVDFGLLQTRHIRRVVRDKGQAADSMQFARNHRPVPQVSTVDEVK